MAIRSYDVLAVGAIAGGVLFSHAIVNSVMALRDSSPRIHRVEWIETAAEAERTIVIESLKHIRPNVVVVPRTRSVVRFVPLPEVTPVAITPPMLEGDGAVLLHDESGGKRVKIIVRKRKKSGEGGTG